MTAMTKFSEILEAAEQRAGGAAALEAHLPKPKTAAELRAVPDDRYLSLMCLRIFQAGLKHSLVEAKWPAFEEAFLGFDPRCVRAMSDEELERLMSDKRLIRHGGKMQAVHKNAAAFCDLAEEYGGFGAYLAAWDGSDAVGLWDDLTKRFSQVGGNSGPYFLRMAGKDTFVLTGDVMCGLVHWGALEQEPKGKTGRRKAQIVFNAWVEETGRPLCQLSMIVARSFG